MIQTLSKAEATRRMNELGKAQEPFLFIIDFEMEQHIVLKLDEIPAQSLLYDFNGKRNFKEAPVSEKEVFFEKHPVTEAQYHGAFQLVMDHIKAGNSYLVNLAFPTPISTNIGLREAFFRSRARYRLWLKGQFTCFSPEPFITIDKSGRIASFPMKGTRTQAEYKQRSLLLDDPRENAEHATIVDVLRTDLARIADEVELVKYRYVDQVNTAKGQLLQTSSVIQGQIKDSLKRSYGTILSQIFPPGSVSGSPKDKSIHIIRRIEGQPRGYYTGIMGYFDGLQMDSAVLIRFVEQTPDGYFFRSGAGITMRSEWLAEYQEMLAKCQLPLAREHRHLMQGALV